MLNKDDKYFAVTRKIWQTIMLRSLGGFFWFFLILECLNLAIEKGSCNQLANILIISSKNVQILSEMKKKEHQNIWLFFKCPDLIKFTRATYIWKSSLRTSIGG